MKTLSFFIILFQFSSFYVRAQSISQRLDRINSYTNASDPYKRFFTFNESNGKLKWVTGTGDITCEAVLKDVRVYKEPSGSGYYVTFATKDGSTSIYCSYGGNTKLTSISINSSSDADRIVSEIQAIASGSGGSGGGGSGVDVQAVLSRVNQLCREYDNYIRKFSFDGGANILTWVNKDGDITCKANLSKVKITMEPNSTFYSVMFTCLDGSKCIDCTYGGATNRSSVSIERKEGAAIEIVEKLNLLNGAKNVTNTGGGGNVVSNGRFVPQPQRN